MDSEVQSSGGVKVWIALLRGINVAGRNRLPMAQLADSLRGLGLRRVTTYLQSGNVIFEGPEIAPSQLADEIGNALFTRFGFRPLIFLLTRDQLNQVLADNPFRRVNPDDKALHCFFLFKPASAADTNGLNAARSAREQWVLKNGVLFLYTPDGFGRSKLAATLEKLIGIAATARNWRTITQLCQLADAHHQESAG
jgi:uncharacterized protein (DUF1697 family)